MIKIVKHQNPPQPAPMPPATYDLLGLTDEQFALITALVGHALTKTHEVETFGLYRGMKDAVDANPVMAKMWKRIATTVELESRNTRVNRLSR